MGIVEVPKGRASVTNEPDGLQIVIPSRKNVFAIIFLLIWLCFWFFGESSAIRDLSNPKSESSGFTAIWLAAWTAGGCFALLSWLWTVAGREVLKFGSGRFTHRRAIGPVGWTKTYEIAHVKEMRAVPAPAFGSRGNGFNSMGLTGGQIAFDYGSRTINIGNGIDEAEAKALIEQVRRRYSV
ncbi:hypothetical protein [Lysobacter terrae]